MKGLTATTPEINLLPGEEIESAPLGKFLKWALTAGRYIVVFTELIVLLAFLSRFKLDRDITDLSEEISRKKSIIVASVPFENTVRKLQSRLTLIKDLTTKLPVPEEYLPFVAKILPVESMVQAVSIEHNTIKIFGVVPTEAGLTTLVSNLGHSAEVQDIAIEKVTQERDGDPLSFTLVVKLWL